MGQHLSGPRLLAAAVFAVAGLAMLWVASAQSTRSGEHRADRAELELVSVRTDVARAQRDEMTAQMALPFGLVTAEEVAAASSERVEAVATGRAALLAIDIDPGIGAERHGQLVEEFEAWVPSGPTAATFDLYTGANVLEFEARPPVSDPVTVIDALQQLPFLDTGPQFVLQESMIVEFGHTETTPVSGMPEFFSLAAAFISGERQIYGPDPSDPLVDGAYWIDGPMIHEAATVDAITALLVDTDLWEADQRNGNFVPGSETPGEVDLPLLYEQSMAVTESVRLLTDQRLDAQLEASGAAADSADALATLARYAAAAFLAIAAAALLFSAAGYWRRSRELRHQVNIDPLTGVGNRNLLQSKTAALLATDDLDHHTIVMIDMDRFKMINDTYGHAAGDSLLQEIAAGLEEVGGRMAVAEVTVVRLGGDEFTLTLHDRSPIDLDALAELLDQLRGRSVTIDGKRSIPISFSYGIASATNGPNLDDLLEAADLAAYDQKSQRRGHLAPIDVTEPARAESTGAE